MYDYRSREAVGADAGDVSGCAPGKRTSSSQLAHVGGHGEAGAGLVTEAPAASATRGAHPVDTVGFGHKSFVDSLLGVGDGIDVAGGGGLTDGETGSETTGASGGNVEQKTKGQDDSGEEGGGDGGSDGGEEGEGGEDSGDTAEGTEDDGDGGLVDQVTPPAPPTVTFGAINYATTPTGVGNRIPPRKGVKVPVTISGLAAGSTVEVSIAGAGGGNGDGKLNGKSLLKMKKSGTITLKGTTQTGAGNAGSLSLVAKVAAAVVGNSNTFTISAIPTKVRVSFGGLITGTERGIKMTTYNNSDSGQISDLDQVQMSEMVKYQNGTGCFAGITSGSNSGYLSANTSPHGTDSHGTPVALVTGAGYIESVQGFKFKDARSGANDIGVASSGFMITRTAKVSGANTYLTTHKYGSGTTVSGITVAAGSGSAKRQQKV